MTMTAPIQTPSKSHGKQLYTQYEYAKAGLITPQMLRIAPSAKAQTPEFIRAEVARGRLVIPANIRHLAGAGGKPIDFNPLDAAALSASVPECLSASSAAGHPGARGDAANLWVNQTVAQRWKVISDPTAFKGINAPKRLDPMAIGYHAW